MPSVPGTGVFYPPVREASAPYDKNKREKLTRSRNGCLTCRLRRKKCTGSNRRDEACEACLRLALECLGYSEKRPAWMQDATKLAACKKEIRCWLAERGKSHNTVERLDLSKYYGDLPTPTPTPTLTKVPKMPVASSSRRQSRMDAALRWALQGEEEDELADDDITDDRVPCEPSPSSDHTVLPIHDFESRALHSELSPSYRWSFLRHSSDNRDKIFSESSLEEMDTKPPRGSELPALSFRDVGLHDTLVARLVSMWTQKVRPFQYRFADPTYTRELCQIMLRNDNVLEVTRNLTALHRINSAFYDEISAPDLKEKQQELDLSQNIAKDKLQEESKHPEHHHQGHGLAAIFGLSYVLFTGGTGDWKSYLEVACTWLERESISIVRGSAKLSHATAFLAEATIWMDILASTSLQKAPILRDYYRRFLSDETAPESCGLFLSRIMGCDNRTMLGIAETSALAEWKEKQVSQGRLNVHELSDEGRRIEATYLSTVGPAPFITITDGESPWNTKAGRTSVTAVFRAAARVYLHTVISGSFPNVSTIARAVDETIECFRGIAKSDADRALVFSLCVTACMARNQEQKDFFMDRFQSLRGAERVGNCFQAQRVVQEVWRRRALQSPRIPVNWWNVADAFDGLILLA